MPEFSFRSDSVNVEQIMDQLRARISEKRGVDYTEQQIRELAQVKLEKFLDPKGVRSDLFDQFKRAQVPYQAPELPNYAFEAETLYESHRGPLRFIRRLLHPILKLFFNPNPIIQALHIQAQLNTLAIQREAAREASRRPLDQLYYEVIHNLVIEATRLGIEVKNLKMRVESLGGRVEFNERRARALESAVVYAPDSHEPVEPVAPPTPAPSLPPMREREPQPYRPEQGQPAPAPAAGVAGGVAGAVPGAESPGQRSRRRRRRRGRRGGASATSLMGGQPAGGPGAGGAGGADGVSEPVSGPVDAASTSPSADEHLDQYDEPAAGGPDDGGSDEPDSQ